MNYCKYNTDKTEYESNLERCVKTFWEKCTWLSQEWRILDVKFCEEFMCFEFQGYMLHAEYKTKYPLIDLLEYLLNSFYMFGIWIWNEKNDEPDAIGIKWKKFKKVIGYDIKIPIR